MKFRIAIVATIAASLVSPMLMPASAATWSSTFFLTQTPSFPESQISFHGVIKPKIKNALVGIDVRLPSGWKKTRLSTKSTSSGAWKIRANLTAFDADATYRARFTVKGKSFLTKTRSISIRQTPELSSPTELLTLAGPGGRIHGTDVSRWQHPGDKPIDFVKMYNAGMRFVIIKASDTRDEADTLALKYLLMNRNAAQAAGLFTGYYHYAVLPNTTDRDAVIRDSKAQAQKVVWRLSSLGGYTERDLPYALDLENNCVAYSGSSCIKYAQRSLVTLWAETWMAAVHEKTNRKPFFYSYPTFLEQAMVRSKKLREYPLWKAQYGIDPADPTAEPGRKIYGCYVHSWSTGDCSSLWQIWQYSSCGIGAKYGVASARIDLNVFRGDANSFLELTRGTWSPQTGDFLPVNEATTMTLGNVTATTTDKDVRVRVEVRRPSGDPVVTGTVAFKLSDEPGRRVEQTPVRDASGSWTLRIRNLPAGTYSGSIIFVDQTNTHARVELPITFTLAQGVEVTPSPTPRPSPVRPPVDTCKGQIKN